MEMGRNTHKYTHYTIIPHIHTWDPPQNLEPSARIHVYDTLTPTTSTMSLPSLINIATTIDAMFHYINLLNFDMIKQVTRCTTWEVKVVDILLKLQSYEEKTKVLRFSN